MSFRPSRKKMLAVANESATDWVYCGFCGKGKVRENAFSAGEGERWYCSEKHLHIGERQYQR